MVSRDVMRARFFQAVAWQGWTQVDQREINAAIKAAWDALDEAKAKKAPQTDQIAILAAWDAWLEELSGAAFFGQRCRDFEARVHREAKAVAAARKKAA